MKFGVCWRLNPSCKAYYKPLEKDIKLSFITNSRMHTRLCTHVGFDILKQQINGVSLRWVTSCDPGAADFTPLLNPAAKWYGFALFCATMWHGFCSPDCYWITPPLNATTIPAPWVGHMLFGGGCIWSMHCRLPSLGLMNSLMHLVWLIMFLQNSAVGKPEVIKIKEMCQILYL